MVNGAIGFIISKAEARSTNSTFDNDVYPTGSADTDQFTIVKVTNNRSNRGGIFLAYQQQGQGAYIGVHTTGKETDLITWRKFSFTDDLETLSARLSSHITDTNNPHRVNKAQINLKNVENLPVISRGEVLCLDPVRKYVTFDALLLFMKSFMVGKNGGEVDPLNGTDGPLENVQILYCPSSNCNCDEEEPAATFAPAGTLLSQSCVGFNLTGTYANGSGGTYQAVITANSPTCGYEPPADPVPSVSGLNVITSVNSNLQWVVSTGKPNTTFTHQYGLAGQAPVTNTYTLNASGSFSGTLNTGTAAGVIQSTFIFVNNHTVVQNTTVQAQPTFTGTSTQPVNLNSAVLSTSKTVLNVGDTATLSVDIVGTIFGRTYNLEYWVKSSSESSFTRSFNTDIPPNYTANGASGNFQMSLANIDGTTIGVYSAYIKITDSANSSNTINTNTISVNFVAPPSTTSTTPPPTTTYTTPPPGTTTTPPPTTTAARLLTNMTLTVAKTDIAIGETVPLSLNYSTTIAGRAYSLAMLGRIVGTSAWFPWVAATTYPRSISGNGGAGSTNWTEQHNDTTLTANVSMEIKGVLTDTVNASNKVESNAVIITLRPPVVTPPPVSISNVTVVLATANPMPPGTYGTSNYSVTGLIPGKSYKVDYYAKFSTDANYTLINTLVQDQFLPTKSFVATGNTQTFSSTHDNTGGSPTATLNYYCVVTQIDNPANTRQSNIATITQLGPQVTTTTPPPTSVGSYKQVTLKNQQNGNVIGQAGVARQSNGDLQFNIGTNLSGYTYVAFMRTGSFWDDPIQRVVEISTGQAINLGSNNYSAGRTITQQEWESIIEVWVTSNSDNFA